MSSSCYERAAQADDWILYSTKHQAELARVRCGGWRRQYTHIVSTPFTFTFACYRNRHIHIDRRHGQDGICQHGTAHNQSQQFQLPLLQYTPVMMHARLLPVSIN